MKYYVAADVHGFYTQFHHALEAAGYFTDPEEHRLIILGDVFDRGREALEMQSFILGLMDRDAVILIRGNHEDLFEDMVQIDKCRPLRQHVANGTYGTALRLTGVELLTAEKYPWILVDAAVQTPYYQRIIPAAVDYFETKTCVFVHGWIPCALERGGFVFDPRWREAEPRAWRDARWINGMDAARTCAEPKTVFCGHWHCSYGHARYEHIGSEFGPDADFSPYFAPGVVAMDACTAHSGRVNILVIEDEPLQEE